MRGARRRPRPAVAAGGGGPSRRHVAGRRIWGGEQVGLPIAGREGGARLNSLSDNIFGWTALCARA